MPDHRGPPVDTDAPVRARVRTQLPAAPEAAPVQSQVDPGSLTGEDGYEVTGPLAAPEAAPVQPHVDPGSPAGEDGYKVGYGKPPKHSRFPPGYSGNSKGRKKGTRSLRAMLTTLMDKPIKVKSGGKLLTMRQREAVAHRLLERALGGDLKAIAMVMKIEEGGSSDEAMQAAMAAAEPLKPHEQELYDSIVREKLKARGVID